MISHDYIVHDVVAILPDRVLDGATITVRSGVVVAIEADVPAPPGAIDGRGAFCLPGLVDTHSDGLEKELRPRPGVMLEHAFALRSFEGRVRASGVTTVYHGIGFEEDERHERSVDLADRLSDAIEHRRSSTHATIDHHLLYRLDARDADGFDALTRRLPGRLDDGALPLVSFEDHTPGQGQYLDRTAFERYIAGTRKIDADAARQKVDELIEQRELLRENRDRALPWLTTEARAGRIRLMAHDPANADDVDEAATWHATIAEFPTTIDAARRAREMGLRTVCGAPNVLRGHSHSGNVSARELIALGLCDGLASDYLPSTMIGAVVALWRDGSCTLPEAVALVSSGPADTVGLPTHGRIAEGARGDLVLVRFDGSWPTVRAVLRADDALHEDDESYTDRTGPTEQLARQPLADSPLEEPAHVAAH